MNSSSVSPICIKAAFSGTALELLDAQKQLREELLRMARLEVSAGGVIRIIEDDIFVKGKQICQKISGGNAAVTEPAAQRENTP